MSKVFGFIEAADDLNKFVDNALDIENILDEEAEKIKNEAIKIATSKGLVKTGAGIEGIQVQKQKDKRKIGWADRPNFHLSFHEFGFHGGNRKKAKKGKSKRKIGARFVPPKPHLRPAFDNLKDSAVNRIKQKIEGGR